MIFLPWRAPKVRLPATRVSTFRPWSGASATRQKEPSSSSGKSEFREIPIRNFRLPPRSAGAGQSSHRHPEVLGATSRKRHWRLMGQIWGASIETWQKQVALGLFMPFPALSVVLQMPRSFRDTELRHCAWPRRRVGYRLHDASRARHVWSEV